MPGKLTVAINAEIAPHYIGGSESAVLSLIRMMGRSDCDIDQMILSIPKYVKAFEPKLGPNQQVIPWQIKPAIVHTYPISKRWSWLRDLAGPFKPQFDDLVHGYRRRRYGKNLLPQAVEPKKLRELNAEVIHFPMAQCFMTDIPFIYEPHDLQQFHFPEFFSPEALDYRERLYGYGCLNSRLIVCGTWWTKRDIMHQYALPAERIAVIPRYSVNARADLEKDEQAFLLREAGFGEDYIIYPAMCFPNKNHLRLFEAMARLRDKTGRKIVLVCTGRIYEPHHPALLESIAAHGLEDQVRFTGPLEERLYTALLHGARFIIFPSLFEGLSQSLLEGLALGKPIVAARQSSIPETVGEAALLHDGEDVDSIAESLQFAFDHPEEIAAIGRKGPDEMHRYDWGRAARTFVACYKHVAGRVLTSSEEALLARALSPTPPIHD